MLYGPFCISILVITVFIADAARGHWKKNLVWISFTDANPDLDLIN
jgi:hypothetical protein